MLNASAYGCDYRHRNIKAVPGSTDTALVLEVGDVTPYSHKFTQQLSLHRVYLQPAQLLTTTADKNSTIYLSLYK